MKKFKSTNKRKVIPDIESPSLGDDDVINDDYVTPGYQSSNEGGSGISLGYFLRIRKKFMIEYVRQNKEKKVEKYKQIRQGNRSYFW